jgi:hypothetical protein
LIRRRLRWGVMILGRSSLGKSFEFGGDAGGLDRPDPLEDLQRAAQPVLCLGFVAGGKSAPAQAGQRVGLIPGAVDLPGQVGRFVSKSRVFLRHALYSASW